MGPATVLWTSEELGSAEHFTLDQDGTGAVLRGISVLAFGGHPAHIGYEVRVDHRWRTRSVDVEIVGGPASTIRLRVGSRGWTVNGVRRADLADCVDVDLGFTPATNMLPIRRLAPALGESVRITAAWLRFPELVVEAVDQRYSHEGESTWRYRSGRSDHVLETTPDGIVTRYGDDLWVARALAAS